MANRSPVSDRVLQAIVTIQRARRVAGDGARGGQGGMRGVESQQQSQASQRSHGGGADGRVRGGGGSLKAVVAEVAGALEKREVEELMTELQRRHDWKATLEVFAWSQQQAWFRPNMRLYNALMGFLAREQQAHAATLLFQDMLLSRARPNHFTYTALINAYGRAGWFEDALAVFHHMKTCDDDDCRPNTVTCNALIGALCKGGMYDEAVEVFMDMRAGAGGSGGLPLNCSKGGMYDEAVEVFMDMRAGAGGAGGLPLNCRPNIVTYNTLIDTLPNIVTYNTLMFFHPRLSPPPQA
ncbi:unnamed protein product [Closterium sp. Naga37s-1]|nr:unnamed protein product [Closterium sp. Naga37s-1]